MRIKLNQYFPSYWYIRPILSFFIIANLLVYISEEPLAGWDTIGHRHLFEFYWSLFLQGESIGYDFHWFQGYPAFYFYPPFFYFLTSLIRSTLMIFNISSVDLAFNIGILLVIIFFADSLYCFCRELLDHSLEKFYYNFIPVFAVLVYLLYPGEGLQAAGLIGAVEGTFVSMLGHALVLRLITSLNKYRIKKLFHDYLYLILYTSLLFYTHFLSLVFCSFVLIIYAMAFKNTLPWKALFKAIVVVFLIVSPVVFLYLKYNAFRSGFSLEQNYPPLLSWLGKDFYTLWKTEERSAAWTIKRIFVDSKWIQILSLLLILSFLWERFIYASKNHLHTFVTFSWFILLWLAVDSSAAALLPKSGIHWYRSFDIFLSFSMTMLIFKIQSLYILYGKHSWFKPSLIITSALILYRFTTWDPFAHQDLKHTYINQYANTSYEKLETVLNSLPKGSMVLPELRQDKANLGSPHALDYWIQKTHHRNAVGLVIESAPSARLIFGYVRSVLPSYFQWGIPATWQKYLFTGKNIKAKKLFFYKYLRRSGVHYILGQSKAFDDFLTSQSNRYLVKFKTRDVFLFEIKNGAHHAASQVTKPIGLLSTLDYIDSGLSEKKKSEYFLLTANKLRNTHNFPSTVPIVHLTPKIIAQNKFLFKDIQAVVVVYNPRDMQSLNAIDLSMFKGKPSFFWTPRFPDIFVDSKEIQKRLSIHKNSGSIKYTKRLPIKKTFIHKKFLTKFDTKNQKIIIDFQGKIDKNKCIPIVIHSTYFPGLKVSGNREFLQSDSNQIYICVKNKKIIIRHENRVSYLITIVMALLLLSLGILLTYSFWKKTSI